MIEFEEDYELESFSLEDFRTECPFDIPEPTTLEDW